MPRFEIAGTASDQLIGPFAFVFIFVFVYLS